MGKEWAEAVAAAVPESILHWSKHAPKALKTAASTASRSSPHDPKAVGPNPASATKKPLIF